MHGLILRMTWMTEACNRIFDHYMVFDVYDIILNVILYSDLTSEETKNDLRKCT